MKPRTPLQKRVAELSAKLPPITAAQRAWIEKRPLEKVAYLSKGLAWCTCCGMGFKTDVIPLEAIVLGANARCPICGSKVEMKSSRKKKHQERYYFTIPTICKEFQVLRHFIVERDVRQFKEPLVEVNEAVQNWISPDGTVTHVARKLRTFTKHLDDWYWHSPMEVREARQRGHAGNRYVIESAYIYSGGSITPELRKRGYNRKVWFAAECMPALLRNDHIAEMLVKNRHYRLLYLYMIGRFDMELLPAVRICNRNRYVIDDASDWVDYIRCLIELGKDIRNAHYVCPPDLQKAHGEAVRQVGRLRAKRASEERLKKAAEWEKSYAKAKGRFFGICFGNDDIVITVISSVAEMAEEGEAMHHCVYANEYYKDDDSLILSAKSSDGRRLATIEFSLKTFRVLQCRGVCNAIPPRHKEILQLIQDNIGLIRKAA